MRRIRAALAAFVVLMLATVGQLVNIQVLRAEEYADRGVRQRSRTIELPGTRGRIYDREGDILATSVAAVTVYADPRAYRASELPDGTATPPAGDVRQVARELAPLIGRDAAWIEERLGRDAHFVYLARQVDRAVAESIAELRLPGIGLIDEPKRVYPSAGLAAQVVGFVGIDGEALAGLEQHHDAILQGHPGTMSLERAPGGLEIASGAREVTPSRVGTDIVLTIDREIQAEAERVAAETVAQFGAKGASVVVLEVGTGDILAMASVPTFDPNARSEDDAEAWRNRAVTDVFEPGSIQKALTIAAALDAGVIGREQVFDVGDRLVVADKEFTDSTPHSRSAWTATDIMARSSNVGAILIAQQLGRDDLHDYLVDFGYGRRTGLDFPGESAGLLRPAEEWWGTSLPTIAIGYGIAATLLQVADSYATIANGGLKVQPRLVRGTVGDDGTLVPTAAPASTRVVSAAAAAAVTQMLEQSVISEGATGGLAVVPGFRVGGKTGTALKPAAGTSGYTETYVASFVGFAPIDDPRIVVAVMVDEPYPFYGGIVAAPAFSRIMHAALLARRIAPGGTGSSLTDAFDAAREQAEAAELAVLAPATPPVDG